MGTNYGAFLTSLVVGQSKINMCGVLTSPVSQWRYHGTRMHQPSYQSLFQLFEDVVEAEEYLGFPNDSANLVNYEIASLINHLPNLKHHQILLVHGIQDPLVSLEQTMALSKVISKHPTIILKVEQVGAELCKLSSSWSKAYVASDYKII